MAARYLFKQWMRHTFDALSERMIYGAPIPKAYHSPAPLTRSKKPRTKKIMKDLTKELSPEQTAKLEAAIAAGATHARFTYADGSYHAYPIREINRGMNAHRRSRLGLELVKVVTTNEKLASLPFWNSFVDDREINPN